MKPYTPRLIDYYNLPKDSTHEDCIMEARRQREEKMREDRDLIFKK